MLSKRGAALDAVRRRDNRRLVRSDRPRSHASRRLPARTADRRRGPPSHRRPRTCESDRQTDPAGVVHLDDALVTDRGEMAAAGAERGGLPAGAAKRDHDWLTAVAEVPQATVFMTGREQSGAAPVERDRPGATCPDVERQRVRRLVERPHPDVAIVGRGRHPLSIGTERRAARPPALWIEDDRFAAGQRPDTDLLRRRRGPWAIGAESRLPDGAFVAREGRQHLARFHRPETARFVVGGR